MSKGSSPAVHGDGVVACLLLLLLHCRDQVNHAFALSGDSNLRPAMEMELSHHTDLLFLAGQGLFESNQKISYADCFRQGVTLYFYSYISVSH